MNAHATTTMISSHLKNTTIPWELNDHAQYHEVQNQLDEALSMRVIVDKYIEFNGTYVLADHVRFTCNNVSTVLQPGVWTSCFIKPGNGAYVSYDQHYEHGAQGVFDVDFD